MNVGVIGLQWGDEGKGKIIDLIAEYFDIVTRFQAGHNAGHTVYRNGKKFVVHHIPAGIFHEKLTVVMGHGMVVDLEALYREIMELEHGGIVCTGRLKVSDRIHVITPLHRFAEAWEEQFRGKGAIGTTRRGIGPCYEDKYGRRGITVGEVLDGTWGEKFNYNLSRFKCLYPDVFQTHEFAQTIQNFKIFLEKAHEWLRPYVEETDAYIRKAFKSGKALLFEGAQGTLLDIDHGTYPFVTSSYSSIGGVLVGLGLGPKAIHKVLGVSKAYTTRVGAGAFPTELKDDVGTFIREKGKEYGATTGRPRRCGWLDLVALKYACDLNDVDGIVLTKLDILDGLETVKVCTSYRIDGKLTSIFPARNDILVRVEPVYEELPGWKEPTYGVRDVRMLPSHARTYIRFIEEFTGRPVVILSSGPLRDETAWFVPPAELFGGDS